MTSTRPVKALALEDLTEGAHHRLEVLDLVVRRQADDEPHPHIIARWPAPCPRTPSSRTASSSSPTFSSWTAPTRFGSPPTAGRRPGSATPRRRWPGSRWRGRRRRSRESAARSRRRSWSSPRPAICRRSRSFATGSPAGSSRSCTCPGSGPRRPGSSGPTSASSLPPT